MNSKHPIDEFFHSKLQDFEMDPPMHLWENIEKKRSSVFWLTIRKGLVIGLILGGTLIWWQTRPENPQMGNFPIPLNTTPIVSETANPGSTEIAALPHTPDFPKIVQSNSTTAKTVLQHTPDPIFPKGESTSHSHPLASDKQSLSELTVSEQPNSSVASEMLPLPVLSPLVSGQGNPTLQQNAVLPVKRLSNKWKLSLNVFAAPEYALKKLSPQNDASDAFLQAQQNTEQAWLSYSTGIEIQAVSPRGLTFATGLQYNRINEKFDFYNPSEKRLKISDVKGPGNYLVGLDTIVITGQRWKTSRNYQTALAIPLLLGYEKSKGKISLGVYGGPLIHIYNDYRKDLPDQEGYPVRLSGASDDPLATDFPAAWQLSWQIRAGLQYNWTPKMQLFTAPQFRFSRGAGTILTKENYWVGGLTMGVRTRIY